MALASTLANRANAGSINLSVDLNGVVIFSTASVSPDQSVEAILTSVNGALASHGSAYRFTTLSAQSNYTGGADGSLQTTFQLNTSGAGTTAATLSIDTSQSGFLAPVGTGGSVVSTAGGSYVTAAGTLSYTSDFQGANTPTLASTASGTNSFSSTTGAIAVGSVPSGYELSNHFLINLTKGTNSFLGATGGVIVSANVIPEPSSVVILLTGLPVPLVFMGMVFRRRKFKV